MSLLKNSCRRLYTYISFAFSHAFFLTAFYILIWSMSACMPVLLLNVNAGFMDALTDAYVLGAFTPKTFQSAATLLLAIFMQFLLLSVVSFIGVRLCVKLGTAYDLQLAEKKSKIKFLLMESSDTYELLERVSEECSNKMFEGIKSIFSAAEYLIRILGIVVTVACFNVMIGILTGLLLVLIVPIAVKGGKEDYEAYVETTKKFRRAKYFKGILSGRDNVAERTLFRFSDWMIEKWDKYYTEGRLLSKEATKRNFIRIKFGSVASVMICGGIMLLMLPGLKNGSLTVGLYMAVVTAVISLSQLMTWNIACIVENLVVADQYISDYEAFMSLEEMKKSLQEELPFEQKSVSCIEFNNVSFRYPQSDSYALQNISFRFLRGKTYAIVGENGSGKSTLVKLMLGFYDNYEGNIFIDGRELRTFHQEELCNMFACAFQDFARYELSVRDNIAIGAGNKIDFISDEKIYHVLKQVGLDTYVSGLSNGMYTHLGRLQKYNHDISGGQWQRIAIARALIKNAPVCIIDEPTAALDPASELEIYQLLYEILTDRLGILITHRLNGVARAEEILVLHKGKLMENGAFDELMKVNGLFLEMYDLQRSWYR